MLSRTIPFCVSASISLLVAVCPLYGQSDTTRQKTKKKSAVGQLLKQTGEELLRANGINVGNENGRTGSSRGGLSSITGNTIRGEWNDYGGGGHYRYMSPRNHTYYFDVTQNNTQLTFEAGSEGKAILGVLYDPLGNRLIEVASSKYGSNSRADRAGTYKLVIGTRERNQLDAYTLMLSGPVTNIRREQVPYWQIDAVSFGEQGGGGLGNSLANLSPRNHFYTFEPVRGSMFDVNLIAQRNVRLEVFAPDGSTVPSMPNEGENAVEKANLQGQYQIVVMTDEPNVLADYKLEVVGNLKTKPARVEMQQQVVKGRWDATSRKHVYTMAVLPGMQEILLRSRTTNGKLYYLNANNEEINPYKAGNLQSAREQNMLVPVLQTTELVFYVETEQPTGGDYELLVTGKFSNLKQQALKTQKINSRISQEDQRAGQRRGTIPGAMTAGGVSTETVLLTGRVRSSQPALNLTTMRVVYEDLATAEQVGEVIPDVNGRYSFAVPAGRHYGITVVSSEGHISSSQSVDLTSKTTGKQSVVLGDIIVITGEVGEVINLNNIFFQTGKATLLPQSYAELNRLGTFLKEHPNIRIEIAGHTDSQGSSALNKTLSNDRALSVAYNLRGQQISPDRIRAVGYGMNKPVASNASEMGRAQNRRVEFRIIGR